MNIIYRDKTWQMADALTVTQLLERLEVLPENVLVIRNGKLVSEDHPLSPGDEVKIVDVISGG